MNILARYLMRTVVGYTALVMTILLILCGLYLFMNQQDDIGVGNYQTSDAFVFMLLNLPQYAFELLPIAALIGSLLGLGNLARSSELVVMRTSGTSLYRMSAWVASAGVMLALVTWVIGDYVAPSLQEQAQQRKTFAKFNQVVTAGDRSAWAKEGNTFISVQQQRADNHFGGLFAFEFDDQRHLKRMFKADSARLQAGNRWRLDNFAQSSFDGNRVIPVRKPTAEFETKLSSDFLGLAMVEPESLSGMALYRYVQHLHSNGVDARAYETEFWARIARTVALVLVVVLAVPISLGPLRSTGTGARAVVGILVGAAFFLLANVLENGGQVFNLSPLVVAWAPTALLALVTSVAIYRAR